MLKKNNFFKNYFTNSKQYNKNLKKTKKIFNHFLLDLKSNQIPLLESYKKSYEFDFSKKEQSTQRAKYVEAPLATKGCLITL